MIQWRRSARHSSEISELRRGCLDATRHERQSRVMSSPRSSHRLEEWGQYGTEILMQMVIKNAMKRATSSLLTECIEYVFWGLDRCTSMKLIPQALPTTNLPRSIRPPARKHIPRALSRLYSRIPSTLSPSPPPDPSSLRQKMSNKRCLLKQI